jgi:hypothetical protein
VVAFCVGYRRILESFRPLAAKGAKAAAIFDGGFAERGEEEPGCKPRSLASAGKPGSC